MTTSQAVRIIDSAAEAVFIVANSLDFVAAAGMAVQLPQGPKNTEMKAG